MKIILLYHRVAELDPDPFDLAVHPDNFAAHLEHLQRLGVSAPLSEMLSQGSDTGVAITFDDGYADNATVAAPLVADAGLPATWFINPDRLGQQRFWSDRLAESLLRAHSLPPSLTVDIAGHELWLDLRSPAARSNALWFVRGRLMALSPTVLESTVDRLLDQLGTLPSTQDALTMTVDQLRGLATLPHQDVGAHTRTHAQLIGKPADIQRDEILGSVRILSEMLERPVVDFAYPYGSSEHDIGSLAPRLVVEAGCRLACTTDPGPIRRRRNPYLLPRLYVADWGGQEFAARLDAALSAR